MSDWEPEEHSADPMVNAVLNVAAAIDRLASATNGLLYGLKYSKDQGMSLAEAIEVSTAKAADTIASAISEVANRDAP